MIPTWCAIRWGCLKDFTQLEDEFLFDGTFLMHICAWFHLWLMIHECQTEYLRDLKFNPSVADEYLRYRWGVSKSHRKKVRFRQDSSSDGPAVTTHRCYLSPLYTNHSLVEKKIAIVKQVFRFFPLPPPSSHINMCLSLGSRQVSLKLSSDQTKKTDFWQNKVSLWSKETAEGQVQT